MTKQKKSLIAVLIVAGTTFFVFVGFFYNTQITHRGKYDIVDKENSKVGILFQKTIEKEKERIEGGVWYGGIMPSASKRIEDYLKTIKEVESYASKGTESSDKFNSLEVKILFNDGKVVDKLYTGKRVLQAYGMGAELLVKIIFENGKIIKSYTNGAELNDSPENIMPQLDDVSSAIINYDRKINPNYHFYPSKTDNDIQKEWEEVK
jgi:hypothetical protein